MCYLFRKFHELHYTQLFGPLPCVLTGITGAKRFQPIMKRFTTLVKCSFYNGMEQNLITTQVGNRIPGKSYHS